MKITVKTKNLELTGILQQFVERKICSIKKFLNILKKDTPDGKKTLAEVFVELGKETKHHKKGQIFLTKILVSLPGKSLMSSFRADDIFKSVVGAKDELKLEIEKYKFKNIDKNRRQQRKAKKT